MLVWVLKDGENLPVQPDVRPMRTWMLSNALVERGHSVVWWSSTFSHQRKKLLYDRYRELEIKPLFILELLYAGGYKKNISFQRYKHHRLLAKEFRRKVLKQPIPDIIVCAFPIIDLAYEAVDYAKHHNIPIIIDIRDLWPDVFLDKSPRLLKMLVRIMANGAFRQTKQLLRQASSLVAVSEGYIKWGLQYAKRSATDLDKVFYTGYPKEDVPDRKLSKRIQNLQGKVQGKTVFIFIGSFGYSYELKLICDVAQRVADSGLDNISFVIAGCGAQHEVISKRAQSLPNLILLGWLDKFEILNFLSISHVGLVPCLSIANTVPNKPFEYLSAGLPILSSLEGEMEEIIKTYEIGYSYKCGDLDTLYNLVVKLSSDEALRERLSQNASQLFHSRFNSKVIYNEYAAHVENIASNKRRGASG